MATSNHHAVVNEIFPAIEKYANCARGNPLLGLAVKADVGHSARDVLAEGTVLQEQADERTFTVIRAVGERRAGEVQRLSSSESPR